MNLPDWIPKNKRLYLFDVDGVFLKTEGTFSNRYEKQVGKPNLLKDFFEGVFNECLVGDADLKEEVEKHLKDWGWEKDVDDFLKLWFEEGVSINEEVEQIIIELRKHNLPCCFVTNQEKYRTNYLKETFPLFSLMNRVFASSDLGVKKPDPLFYQKVLDEMDYNGSLEDVFYVDDDEKNIAVGKDFGFATLLYKK